MSSSYHYPMEREISNSDEPGPSSGGRHYKIGFPLMRKIVQSGGSTQCSILCTSATAIRSEGHFLSTTCVPLSPTILFAHATHSQAPSSPRASPIHRGGQASTVLCCLLGTPSTALTPVY